MNRYLTHFKLLFLFIKLPLVLPHSVMATTYTVGTCQKPSHPTISAAVAAATLGAIVKPGSIERSLVEHLRQCRYN